MLLPQAIFFADIVEEVGQITMDLGKLELKRESVKGQQEPNWPKAISSAPGGIDAMRQKDAASCSFLVSLLT